MAVSIYPVPAGEAISTAFTVLAGGQPVPVHEAYVSAYPFNRRWPGHQRGQEQREPAWFAAFAADGPVEMLVTPEKPFAGAVVRPLSKGVSPRREGGSLSFTLPGPGGYTLELDGFHHVLHIFVDPPERYDVDRDHPDTLYFGPGVHEAGILTLRSGQTVYIDAGAVVYGCIHARDARNIRILGRGILDNSHNKEEILFSVDLGSGDTDVGNSRREHTIHLINVQGAVIDGLIIRDSLVYNVAAFGCEDIRVENIKTIGDWRYNSDGIDFHNCSRCVVRGCFVRTFDDGICVKGHDGYPQVCEDILVEGCVLWCDWGRALEIGAETRAERMHSILFRDCDIIRTTHVAMDVQNVDYGEVYNVCFEDIRVEVDPVCQTPQIQHTDEDVFVVDPHSPYLPQLMVSIIYAHHEYSVGGRGRGRNHDITFRNIRVTAPAMPPSSFTGYDEEHRSERIRIEGLWLNGRRITTLEEANVLVGDHAVDVTIQ